MPQELRQIAQVACAAGRTTSTRKVPTKFSSPLPDMVTTGGKIRPADPLTWNLM